MHANNQTGQPGHGRHAAPALALLVSLCLAWAPAFLANDQGIPRDANPRPIGPPRAAAVSQAYTYPGAGGQLWQNATHNLTAGLRDDAAWGRTYDGGYLTVNQSGAPYSNTSLVPPGTFNATYSFTNDPVGLLPTDWTGDGNVSAQFQGHSKIFNLTEYKTNTLFQTRQTFSTSRATGIINYWVADTSSTSTGIRIGLENSTGFFAYIYVTGGNFVYYQLTGNTYIAPHVVNRWYHWSLEFDTNTAMVNITLDGQRKLTNEPSYFGTHGEVTAFLIEVYSTATFSAYVDAVDYSWTPGWTPYRNCVDLSPVGAYNATHTFAATPVFTVPAGWADASGANCRAFTAPAGPAAGGHKNVLVLDDQSAGAAANATVTAPAAITAGSIEYWVAASDVAATSTCATLYDAGETGLATSVYFSGGQLLCWSGGSPFAVEASVSANTWYHLRVDVDCTYDNFSIYVNGIPRINELPFQANIAAVDHLRFNTSVSGSGHVLCVDALDFSTDPAYAAGRSSYVLLQDTVRLPTIAAHAFRFTLNASGADYAGAWTSFDVVAWSGPQDLAASSGTYHVNLTWDAFTDTGGNPVTGYNVYRGTASGAETFLATVGPVTAYHDPGLVARVPYYYTVTALSALGETPFSGEASALPVTEPAAPQSLVATPGNRSVNLTWAPPADTGGTWVTNYVIYRSTTSGAEVPVGVVGNTTLTTNQTGLINGWTYYFQVSANNSVGEGPRSAEASAAPCTTASAPRDLGIAAGDGFLDLSWVDPASGGGAAITGFAIYRGTASGALSLRATVGYVSTFHDAAVANGVKYYYAVAAINAAGAGQNTTEASGTPSQPLQLATARAAGGVQLTWNTLAYVATYKVYRSSDPHFDYRLWDPVVATAEGSFLDAFDIAGNPYYYQVVGYSAGGEVVVASDVEVVFNPNYTPPFDPMVLLVPGIAAGAVVVAWGIYRRRNRVPGLRHRGL